jgi:hypothetical protein
MTCLKLFYEDCLASHSLTQSEAMTTPPRKRHYNSLLQNIDFQGYLLQPFGIYR